MEAAGVAGWRKWERLTVRRVGAIAAVAVLAAGGLSACGDGDDGDGSRPDDVPESAVAVVGDTEITDDQVRAEIAALRRTQPKGSLSGRTPQEIAEQLRPQALTMLLTTAAFEQEAAERDIEVSAAEVRQRWRRTAAQQFATPEARRRFLNGRTEQQILEELRLQELRRKIDEQVAEEAGGGKKGAKAVEEFQSTFIRRWQERTACQDGEAAINCPTVTNRQ